MAKRKHSEESKRRALALCAEHGLAEAHKRTAIAKTTIKGWADRAGIRTFDAEKTRAAVEAHKASLEARRTALAENLLADAERLRTQLFEQATVYDFTKDGDFVTGELDRPTFGDQRQIITATAIAIDKVQLLTGQATARHEAIRHDRIDDAVDELLEEMAERERQAAQNGSA